MCNLHLVFHPVIVFHKVKVQKGHFTIDWRGIQCKDTDHAICIHFPHAVLETTILDTDVIKDQDTIYRS